MSDLTEALEVLDAKPLSWWGTELEGWSIPIVAAARKWQEVEALAPIWFCTTHDATATEGGPCDIKSGYPSATIGRCEIERVRIVKENQK